MFSDYAKERAQLHEPYKSKSNSWAVRQPIRAPCLKSALSGGDGAAIIGACESGEEVAIGAFELVTNLGITGPSRSRVEKQGRKIRDAHARMLRLKAEARGARFPEERLAGESAHHGPTHPAWFWIDEELGRITL